MSDRQLILANLRSRPLSLVTLRDAVESILQLDVPSGRYRLSKKQLAEREGISTRTVDRRVEDGILPPPDIINGRCFWWSDVIEQHDRDRERVPRRAPSKAGKPANRREEQPDTS